jgi:hypothetical protein
LGTGIQIGSRLENLEVIALDCLDLIGMRIHFRIDRVTGVHCAVPFPEGCRELVPEFFLKLKLKTTQIKVGERLML